MYLSASCPVITLWVLEELETDISLNIEACVYGVRVICPM